MTEPTQLGAPTAALTDAQQLLVLAQRIDAFMEWLGGPNHAGWHHIQDIPDKIRDIARKQLLPEPENLPFPKGAYEAEFMQKAGYTWIAQNKPERLTQLARDNRDSVLEQAALVADGWARSNFDESANTMAHNIGNDIRALKSKADPKPGQIVRDAETGAVHYCIAPGKMVLGMADCHQPQNPPRPLASGSGTANTPGNENARPEPPEGVLDMRGMLRRTPVPDFEPELDTPFQAGRPIL